MSIIDKITLMVIDADPTWTASFIVQAVPSAVVKKLREGCRIILKAKADGTDINPEIVLIFNDQAQLTSAIWQQIMPDLGRSSRAFEALQSAARQTFPGRAFRNVTIGSKKVRSDLRFTWNVSCHETLILSLSQPKVRALERKIVLEHAFQQPNAAIAAGPDANRF